MDIQTLWIVVLSIATPVAGVVGFAIQLRQVKKTRLENEKLQLEILALKEKSAQSDQRIVKPTNEEVMLINHGRARFSRTGQIFESRRSHEGCDENINIEAEDFAPPIARSSLKEQFQAVALIGGLVLFVAYLLFDIYRLLAWLNSWLW